MLNPFENNRVEVKSEVGKGTSFTFSIPIKNETLTLTSCPSAESCYTWRNPDSCTDLVGPQSRNARSPVKSIDVHSSHFAKPAPKKFFPNPPRSLNKKIHIPESKTILIVDDDVYSISATENILKSLGFGVVKATSGKDAIDIVLSGQQEFDLIIMDCYMPNMNGIEATSILKSEMHQNRLKLAPILGCTGAGTDKERDSCLAAGMDFVLVKPITKSVIQKDILKYIQ